MSVKLPRAIKIAGVVWKVVRDRYGKSLGDDRGCSDHGTTEITLLTSQPEHSVRSTLLHELIHAVDTSYNPHGPNLTEHQVLALETGLFTVFSDNPGLARIIFGDKA